MSILDMGYSQGTQDSQFQCDVVRESDLFETVCAQHSTRASFEEVEPISCARAADWCPGSFAGKDDSL
jgi:hypothetical protein